MIAQWIGVDRPDAILVLFLTGLGLALIITAVVFMIDAARGDDE